MILDPFGGRASEIIDEFGGLNALFSVIPDYVSHDEAIRRISWNERPPEDVIRMSDVEDVLTFYALLGALSVRPYGAEVEEVIKKNSAIYLARIERTGAFGQETGLEAVKSGGIPPRDAFILERRGVRGLAPEDRESLRISYRLHLSKFLKLWQGSLKEVYIKSGYAYLSKSQAFEVWRGYFRTRFGEILRELDPLEDKFYEEVMAKISEITRKNVENFHSGRIKAQPLRFDLFPPCVKRALSGVPSGMRNYAITVLLTSFLSYARFCPSPQRKDVKMRDCVDNIREIEEEVISVIVEAGNRCSPPLFEDQPNEIKNVWYHLGFGFTEKPDIEDSGNSVWYFPPNCDKIRANAPALCNPDEFCRGVKNPLSYYMKRLFMEKKKGSEPNERAVQGSDTG